MWKTFAFSTLSAALSFKGDKITIHSSGQLVEVEICLCLCFEMAYWTSITGGNFGQVSAVWSSAYQSLNLVQSL